MLVAMKAGHLILAERACGRDGYSCPGCHEPVILRRGRHKIAHFAHRPGSPVSWARGKHRSTCLVNASYCNGISSRGAG